MNASTKIAFLRGINVGGQRRLPMAELRELAVSIGFETPVTYIQSGNLVFESDLDEPAAVHALERAIEQRFGFPVPVVVRTEPQLAAIGRQHPLDRPGADRRLLMVAFLDRAPAVEISDVIDPEEYLPDRYTLIGREVYLDYPNGSGRSRLDHTLLEKRLGVRATVRNWNTVTKLVELARR